MKLFVEPCAGDEGKIGQIKNRDSARGDETCSAGRICFGYVVDTAMQVDTRSIREWVMICLQLHFILTIGSRNQEHNA
jgi:hypothetical protein